MWFASRNHPMALRCRRVGAVHSIKSSLPAAPGGEVLLPGEPERRKRAIRLREGIPLPDDGWESIRETARGAKLRLDAYGF